MSWHYVQSYTQGLCTLVASTLPLRYGCICGPEEGHDVILSRLVGTSVITMVTI